VQTTPATGREGAQGPPVGLLLSHHSHRALSLQLRPAKAATLHMAHSLPAR